MKIYIAKIYTVSTYGFKCLDEEKGFTSYSKALEYLREEFFEEEEDDESFIRNYFAEIVEYDIQNKEVIINKTRFNCLGEVFATLKNTSNQVMSRQPEIKKDFIPTFNIGDIVILKYQDKRSIDLFTDTIGVVSGVPKPYIEWKATYNLPDDAWDSVYLVEFISDSGYLTHCHPVEDEMVLFDKELPEELIILQTLSKHLKKEIVIKDKILHDLRGGDIYALNTKTIKDIDLI